MQTWQTIWTIVLIGSVTIFAAVAVVVAIGGLGDIRSMLQRIKRSHEGSDEIQHAAMPTDRRRGHAACRRQA